MKQDRRAFLKTTAGSLGALPVLALHSCANSAEKDPFAALEPMTAGITPISNHERQERIERARRLMKDNKLDALFLEPGSSMYYFTGVKWWLSERLLAFIIPLKGEPVWICPAFEEDKVRELIPEDADLRIWQEHEDPFLLPGKFFSDLGKRTGRIGLEERVRFFVVDGLRKNLASFYLSDATPVSAGCRMIKSTAELALMQKANDITSVAYQAGLDSLQEGMTQKEFAANVSSAFKALGVSGGVFVQFGKYSAFPHGSREVQHAREGDIVLMDGGCSVEGYRSDISRTVVLGTATPRQKEVWQIIREAQQAVLDAAIAGSTCGDLDGAARKLIVERGFGPGYKFFKHRLGHGIGLDGHEWAYLVKNNNTVLQKGMCFSNEPGIYIRGEFGVRLEDCMYFTGEKMQSFTELSPSIEKPFV